MIKMPSYQKYIPRSSSQYIQPSQIALPSKTASCREKEPSKSKKVPATPDPKPKTHRANRTKCPLEGDNIPAIGEMCHRAGYCFCRYCTCNLHKCAVSAKPSSTIKMSSTYSKHFPKYDTKSMDIKIPETKSCLFISSYPLQKETTNKTDYLPYKVDSPVKATEKTNSKQLKMVSSSLYNREFLNWRHEGTCIEKQPFFKNHGDMLQFTDTTTYKTVYQCPQSAHRGKRRSAVFQNTGPIVKLHDFFQNTANKDQFKDSFKQSAQLNSRSQIKKKNSLPEDNPTPFFSNTVYKSDFQGRPSTTLVVKKPRHSLI